MSVNAILSENKFLSAVVDAARSGGTEELDSALVMKTSRGKVTFKRSTMKSAGGYFSRSGNMALRQQLFDSLAGLAGMRDNMELLNKIREELGIDSSGADGKTTVSNKPLSARQVLDIVEGSLKALTKSRQDTRLKAICQPIDLMPGYRIEAESKGVRERVRTELAKFACDLVGVDSGNSHVMDVMKVAVEHFHNEYLKSGSKAGGVERLDQLARKAVDLLRWEQDARDSLGYDVIANYGRQLDAGVPLATADAIKRFLNAKIDRGMQTLVEAFAKNENVPEAKIYKSIQDDIRTALPVLSQVKGETTVVELLELTASQALDSRMKPVLERLESLCNAHPDLADGITERFGTALDKLVREYESFSTGDVKDWKNLDLDAQTKRITTRAERLTSRLTAVLNRIHSQLDTVDEIVWKGSTDARRTMNDACPGDMVLTNKQCLALVHQAYVREDFVQFSLFELERADVLQLDSENFDAVKNWGDDTGIAKELLNDVAKYCKKRIEDAVGKIREAVKEDSVCQLAFKPKASFGDELNRTANEVRVFFEKELEADFKAFLESDGPKDVLSWRNEATPRLLDKVRQEIKKPGGLSESYEKNLTKIYSTEVLSKRTAITNAPNKFNTTFAKAFDGVDQKGLPSALRFSSTEISAAESQRYGALKASADALMNELARNDVQVDMTRIPEAPKVGDDVKVATARAEKAVKAMTDVVRRVAQEIEDKGLTWLVSPKDLTLNLANFDGMTTDAKLTAALTSLKVSVLGSLNGGKSPDVERLANEIMGTINELSADATNRLRGTDAARKIEERFYEKLPKKFYGFSLADVAHAEQPVPVDTVETTALTKREKALAEKKAKALAEKKKAFWDLRSVIESKVKDSVQNAQKGEVGVLQDLVEWFRRADQAIAEGTKQTIVELGKYKGVAKDQVLMMQLMKDEQVEVRRMNLLTGELGRFPRSADKIASELVGLVLDRSNDQQYQDEFLENSNTLNDWARQVPPELTVGKKSHKMGGTSWVSGDLPVGKMREFIGKIAQHELKVLKGTGAIDLEQIQKNSLFKLFDQHMPDVKVIVEKAKNALVKSLGFVTGALVKKSDALLNKLVDERRLSVVNNLIEKELEIYFDDPDGYRKNYFTDSMLSGGDFESRLEQALDENR